MKTNFDWQKLPESEFSNWDSWVLSNPTGTWFHTIRAFEVVHGKKPEILIVKDDNQNWIAGFPFIRARKFGFSYPKRSPFLYFSSPVIASDCFNNFNAILGNLKKYFSFSILNFTYIETEYPNLNDDFTPQFGWWLPLKDNREEQLQQMEKDHRKKMKTVLSGNIRLVSANSLTRSEIELVHESYSAHEKESPFNTEKMVDIFSRLSDEESAVVKYEKENKTGGWILWLKDKRGFWSSYISAMDRKMDETESFGRHLHSESFEFARKAGCSGMDLMGANTPGIAEFKRRFGCEKRFGGMITLKRNTVIGKILEFKDKQ